MKITGHKFSPTEVWPSTESVNDFNNASTELSQTNYNGILQSPTESDNKLSAIVKVL